MITPIAFTMLIIQYYTFNKLRAVPTPTYYCMSSGIEVFLKKKILRILFP